MLDFYNEKKVDKKLEINDQWCNPGRIDQHLFEDNKTENEKVKRDRMNIIVYGYQNILCGKISWYSA